MQNRFERFLVILSVFLLVSSMLCMMTATFFSFRENSTEVYLVETSSTDEITLLNMIDADIIERYDDHSLVEIGMYKKKSLEETGFSFYPVEEDEIQDGENLDLVSQVIKTRPRNSTKAPLFPGYDPLIHDMMNKTKDSNIYDYIDRLQNFENKDGIRTRRDGTLGYKKAANWTYNKLDSFGLEVVKQNFTYSGGESSNVIAELPGSDPDLEPQTYIIGGHLDSTNNRGSDEPAPGADDNGSGIALVLEAARIMSQYEFDRTIRFAAWGAEETGLNGSDHYASNLNSSDGEMRGYFNYDMVGYAKNDNLAVTLHADEQSSWMLDYKKEITEAYDIGLNLTYEYNSDETRSDHSSFWDEGYNASLAIETEYESNPNYHSAGDTLNNVTIPQVTQLTKQAVGTVGHLAGLGSGSESPSVEIQTPQQGESWKMGNEEEIGWNTVSGDGSITGVDLEYSVDNGSSWSYIAQGLNDTGSYTWTIPNEPTEEAQIRATVHDDNGLSGEDVSGQFTIEESGSEEYTLTIDKEGQGTTKPEAGNHTYTEGDDVTVTATPDEGWYFVEWTGSRESTAQQITIVMDSDKQITAHFQENGTTETYDLTVNTSGEGTMEIDPDQNEYEEDTEVTLTAMPAEGWHFEEWTGDLESTEEQITILMDSDKQITAHFQENGTTGPYDLTVNTDGEGTVNIDPDQNEYDEGTEVTLTAMPAEGWHFDEWTGDRESTEEQITIVMASDMEIIANFQENGTTETYELTVNTDGEGTVEIDPEQNEYDEGTEVTLTAEPADGWYLEEWTDDASGTEEQITVIMDDNKEVTANFAIQEYDLTINIEGQGSTDPSEGTHTYDHGEEVTVKPTPKEGWYFKEWTGDRQSQEEEITIEMNKDKEITAHFEESNPYFEVDITGYKGEVEAGDTVTVRYAVENTGEVEGTQDIILKIDGEEKETNKDLTLGPGEDYTDEFKVVLKEEGTHEIEIASSDMNKAEDVEVEVAQTKDTSGPLSDYWWLIVVLMIGIIAAIALVYMMSGGDEEEEEGPTEQPHPEGQNEGKKD